MSGETVVYKNDLNLVPLRKFTSIEINLFFAMCNKLKEQDTYTLKQTKHEDSTVWINKNINSKYRPIS